MNPQYGNEFEYREMDKLFDRLFPICRSITGPGLRETLTILEEYLPLQQMGLPTGTKVFDWEIPKEWKIKEAWINDPQGNKIIDFNHNNLHVLNYSTAVNRRMHLDELKTHLYTNPKLPNAIPYVTSYYSSRWGFCLTHEQYEKLLPGEYHVYIDSELTDGEMNFAHAILPGESKKEILISSYVCHPSMANNELSGPIVAAFLFNRIKSWKQRRFTYRFVFVPETIGSISYLSMYGAHLKESLYAGLVFTCLGGKGCLSYKLSRRERSQIDQIVHHLFNQQVIKGEVRPFTPANGSDERQYCSPGFNLPVGQIARMVYGRYPEYHTSLDTKEIMTISSLMESLNEIELMLQAIELDGYYVNQFPYGEVKLDKHDLYPSLNSMGSTGKSNKKANVSKILTVLNYADGEHSLLDIADRCNCSILELRETLQILLEKGLIKGPYSIKGEGSN